MKKSADDIKSMKDYLAWKVLTSFSAPLQPGGSAGGVPASTSLNGGFGSAPSQSLAGGDKYAHLTDLFSSSPPKSEPQPASTGWGLPANTGSGTVNWNSSAPAPANTGGINWGGESNSTSTGGLNWNSSSGTTSSSTGMGWGAASTANTGMSWNTASTAQTNGKLELFSPWFFLP